MRYSVKTKRTIAAGITALLLASACGSSDSKSSSATTTTAKSGGGADSGVAAKPSRGFDGTTIRVAGLGSLAYFAGADVGAKARFKRANDTDELKGIKIESGDFSDDKRDPATALSEARRLVESEKVFAIVPMQSPVTPAAYLTAQKVPFVGWGISQDYCTPKASTELWGFAWAGCSVPPAPSEMAVRDNNLYKVISAKTGKKKPNYAIIANDSTSGKNVARLGATSAQAAGFNVVWARGDFPETTSDYSPYIQQWLQSASGKAPDIISCGATAQCIPIWAGLKAAGFKGDMITPLGPLAGLEKAMDGTLTSAFYNTEASDGLTQMQADFDAIKPGTKPNPTTNVPAYFAADMFIQALKKLGKNITPDALQKEMSTMTWGITGLVGPLHYPDSTIITTPYCSELLQSTGGSYKVLKPYSCTEQRTKVDPKFKG
jgi:branched-chain amino acid transport system substrate-binding protein